MKKKIYIVGKVTGLPQDECIAKFSDAQKHLEALGYEVVNPVKMVQEYLFADAELRHSSEEVIWVFAMKKCIVALLDCDAIIKLPDWYESKGAKVECDLANALKMPLFNYTSTGLKYLILHEWNNLQSTEPKAKK